MGLLDDAIREHLDLKRRRGADPTEVEREEREVLGPVQRRVEEAGADEHALEHLHEDEVAHEAEQPHEDEAEHEAEQSHEDEIEYEGLTRDDGLAPDDRDSELAFGGAESRPVAAAPDHDRLAWPVREPEPHGDVEDEPSGADEATTEHRVEDAEAEEDHSHRNGEEDVLEETPEFLQDTPDHDRLWFEQRPPRDFDFDG